MFNLNHVRAQLCKDAASNGPTVICQIQNFEMRQMSGFLRGHDISP